MHATWTSATFYYSSLMVHVSLGPNPCTADGSRLPLLQLSLAATRAISWNSNDWVSIRKPVSHFSSLPPPSCEILSRTERKRSDTTYKACYTNATLFQVNGRYDWLFLSTIKQKVHVFIVCRCRLCELCVPRQARSAVPPHRSPVKVNKWCVLIYSSALSKCLLIEQKTRSACSWHKHLQPACSMFPGWKNTQLTTAPSSSWVTKRGWMSHLVSIYVTLIFTLVILKAQDILVQVK